jgi:hypothetical protein
VVTCLELIAATFVFSLSIQLEFTALHDLDHRLGLVTGALVDVLDLVDNLVSLENLAENDVAAIEPAA